MQGSKAKVLNVNKQDGEQDVGQVGGLMKQIRIDLYRGGPAGDDPRELVRSIVVQTASSKRMTAGRARRVLSRTLPEYSFPLLLHRVEGGWEASRTVEPTKKCSYHYLWEYAVVLEAIEEVEDELES